MRKFRNIFLVLGIALAVSACSSSDKSGEEGDIDELESLSEDEIPVADTDAVPEDSLEDLEEFVPEDGSDEFSDAGVSDVPADDNPTEDFGADVAEGGGDFDSAPMSSGVEGSGEMTSYTVQRGDTLMKIAFEFYGNVYEWRRIHAANESTIPDPNFVPVGTVIQVEQPASTPSIARNGQPYVIQQGDTLGTISQDVYGTPAQWRRIYENNRELIKDANQIFAGFTLYYTFTDEDQQRKEELMGRGLASDPGMAAESAPGVDAGESAPMESAEEDVFEEAPVE